MKRMLGALLLCLLALSPALAAAQDDFATANGVVESAETYEITAPYSGVLLPFDWERGDAVRAGDTLFELDTLKVYAPESGTLTALFVRRGELCEDAARQYGMVAAIEKDVPLTVSATTRGAYNASENKLLHMGARLYFKQSGSGDNKGEGMITMINGDAFVLEVTSGAFDPGDTVKLYRAREMGAKEYVGQGAVERAKDVAVSAAGRVLALRVQEGQRVEKGQLLMELAASDAEAGLASARLASQRGGALESVKVAQGQQVYKGQSLATVASLDALQVVAEVDEIDLGGVKPGDSLRLVLDRYPSEELTGTVVNVSRMGTPKQNATYYDVTLSLETALEALPGMNATVYIPVSHD